MIKEEYWTDEVEEALAKYVSCENITKKNKIFTEQLHEPFKKLILNTVKRYRPDAEDRLTDDISTDLLYHLIIHIQKFNPDKRLPSGRKPNGRIYCEVIIRSSIAEQRLKSAREAKNVCFDETHEIFLNKIN